MSKREIYVVIDGHIIKAYWVLTDVGRDYPVSYRTLLRHINGGGYYRRGKFSVHRVMMERRQVPHPGGPLMSGGSNSYNS